VGRRRLRLSAFRPPTEALLTPRRSLGRTSLRTTPLALAAWSVRAFGGGGLRLTADDVERAYHEHGINTFLFHYMMRPMVEGLRRLIRAGHRDDLVLIAELGIPTGRFVRRGFERHARAVGTDVIDVLLLGWVRARWYLTGRTWRAMERLRDTGRVRAIGFSSHDRPLAARLGREFTPDVLMLRYNAAHRGVEQDVFATLGTPRPGIIAYTATRWGMLLRPLPERGFPRAMTAGECYRFALSNPNVDLVLCAARSAVELREDVGEVGAGPLDAARLDDVRRFGDAVHAAARGGRRWMFR
jgi:aryl-alcohol dehydrogenase-like predicted oxidoreductase